MAAPNLSRPCCSDTEHGIGPKRLGTICSLVLQRSLLQWLDNCQSQLAREREAQMQREAAAGAASPALSRQPSGLQQALAAVRSRRKGKAQAAPALSSGRPSSEAATPHVNEPAAAPDGAAEAQPAGIGCSPFAVVAERAADASSPRPRRLPVSASAPATPAQNLVALGQDGPGAAAEAGALTAGAVPMLAADEEGGSLQRMASLHGYMGMLSLKPPQPNRSMDPSQRAQAAAALGRLSTAATRQLSASLAHISVGSAGSGPQQAARVRFLSEPGVAAADEVAMADAALATESPGLSSPRDLASARSGGATADASADGSAAAQQAQQGGQQTNTITVMPIHRRGSSQASIGGRGSGGSTCARSCISTACTFAFCIADHPSMRACARALVHLPPQPPALSPRPACCHLLLLQGGKALVMFQQPLFQRLRSGEGTPSAPESLAVAAAADGSPVHAAALASALLGEKHSEKDLAMDSEGELGSPSEDSDDDAEDMECGVCLDAAVSAELGRCAVGSGVASVQNLCERERWQMGRSQRSCESRVWLVGKSGAAALLCTAGACTVLQLWQPASVVRRPACL